ncbi:MAG: hypothetical protein M3Z75_06225 [Actinomycetota bacterium]|nr:hypothetical protein [Actinomycetota bacterium]
MYADPSWDIMPVANPELAEGKRRRIVRDSLAKDPVGVAKPLYQVRQREQLVVPFSLDRTCRRLLLRAQVAIDSVIDSGITQAGLPDVVTESTLRRHEWETAVALRDITELRTEHEFNAADSRGPMTDAVLQPHQRALQLAQDAISSRVTALERYAAQVSLAETAYRDWRDALRVSHLNDKYLDLVARTAADEHAVVEIYGLTERAAAAAQAFRDTSQQVSVAAAALVLPKPQAR